MPNNVTTHSIADNKLKIKKDTKEKEYVGLGISKIIVGEETQDILSNNQPRTEIIVNDLGRYESRTAVEAREIYKLSSQSHKNWFILDLETGKRGWFPGCKVKGDIDSAELRVAPDDGAEVIGIITNATVEVLGITRLEPTPFLPPHTNWIIPSDNGWCKVKHTNEGYVKVNLILNPRYE